MFSHTALVTGDLVLVSRAGDDVTPRLGHLKGSSGGGSRRVQPHTLGNSIARRDITREKQVDLRHLSIKQAKIKLRSRSANFVMQNNQQTWMRGSAWTSARRLRANTHAL